MNDIDKKIAKGAAWMVSFKLVDRGLGLVSTIVLARLLVPEDFGLVALAMLLVGALQLLVSFSFDVSLIQNPDAGRDEFDTAWTFNVIFALACAGLLALAAPSASGFYREPRLELVIYVLAAGFALQGFANIGPVIFRREMRFDREFKFLLGKRMASLLVTLPLAFVLRSYWALVIGQLAGTLISLVLSYTVSDYRPRFSLAAKLALFHSSKWLMINNIVHFLNARTPEFVIGRLEGPQALGIYAISTEISTLPTTELVAPINRAAFPGYSRVASRLEELRASSLNVISMIALFALPAGLGVFAVADLMVPVVLGPKWHAAIPLIQVLAVYGVIQALQTNIGYVYMALRQNRIITVTACLQFATSAVLLFVGIRNWGALGAAWALLATVLIMIPVNQVLIARHLGLSGLDFCRKLFRPALASTVMVIAVWTLKLNLNSGGKVSLIGLLICSLAGALVYTIVLYLLWRSAAQPNGPERVCFLKVENVLRKYGISLRLVST
ncbi:MAG TPA: lipopolysaccharide biosynthesis protein [Noviherbaspirillum sp.]|uniref:lipopolysaccharide biosynthesis protein n=1 Tax=Noviherbaspirillum sp. TaxID=1926288 RepID=UPI002DDD8748|nr:lipopolysaccharide biosynthesis protein [Noviherbaspirillum sp.]HEV2608908.1 lipopolysaccharide biosynthesis protein [Noviherbaspirillum sp.]